MFKSATLALATLIATTLAAAAQSPASNIIAQPAGAMCGERANLVGMLKEQYGEEQEEIRLYNDQALMELFASEKGTWSILMTSPSGAACLVAAGKGLSTLARI